MIKPREKAPELEIKLVNNTSWKLSAQSPEHFTMDMSKQLRLPV